MGNSESQQRGEQQESWGLDCCDSQGGHPQEGRLIYRSAAGCCDEGAESDRAYLRTAWREQEGHESHHHGQDDHQSHHHEQNGHHVSVLGLRKQAEEIKRLEREIAQVSICHVHVVCVHR